MIHQLCVCDFENISFLTEEVNELRAGNIEVKVSGHFNQSGGWCCPHWGNTCGSCNDHDNREPVEAIQESESV